MWNRFSRKEHIARRHCYTRCVTSWQPVCDKFVRIGRKAGRYETMTSAASDPQQTTPMGTLQRHADASPQTIEALQASEARYRDLFEHAEDVIFSCALDGTITSVNRATERLLGWPRAALIGQHDSKILTPASIAFGRERVRRSLAGERLPKLFEIEAVRRDGSLVPLEGWARFIRDKEGTPIEFQGIYRDISERKRTTE